MLAGGWLRLYFACGGGGQRMNLVGKIFIVMIFVMSLVFMSMAMAVYATHRNYQAMFIDTGKELNDVKVVNKGLAEELANLKMQIDTIKASNLQSLTKVETERTVLQKDRTQLEKEKADLEKEKRDSVAAMNATQKNATDYRTELEKRRADVLQAQQDRDAHFKHVVELTDELNQAANEKKLLQDRMRDLAKDLAIAREALRWFHINEKSDYKGNPPDVDGRVLAVQGSGLIEISIGSDSGLRKGHRLKIVRYGDGGSSYVGEVEVVETTPDKSVCRIDPKFQNSDVRSGDRVVSQIRSR
jgi:Skp family chaperone for outer membrane proteins